MYPDRLFEIEIFGKPFGPNLYGIMIAVGLLCVMGVLYLYGKKLNISISFLDFIFYNAIASIMLGFGSAALFQALYNYIGNPETPFLDHLSNGGMTFIGGLIGGTAVFLIIYFIARRFLKDRLINALSLAACCILIGHAFGRIGCFFAGCCYGSPTDSFLGVQFPGHLQKVHPTQLYEAAFLFILFAVFSYLLLKKNFRHNMSLYLICYGTFRFLIEYLRGDHRGELVSGISPSQFWSILMVVIGIVLFVVIHKCFPAKKEEAVVTETPEDNTAEAEE